MNARELTGKADQWAENAFLKLIGRVGMASAFPILVASMTWLGSTLWQLQAYQLTQAGKTNEQIVNLSGQIAGINAQIQRGMQDRYRGTDALRDLSKRDQKDVEQDRRLNENAASIKDNSARIRSLETQRGPQ